MTVFDQRGQQVTYQYNMNGQINFNNVHDSVDIVKELQKLQNEVAKARKSAVLSESIAVKVHTNLENAIDESSRPHPDKISIIEYLDASKKLLSGITALAGLIGGISEAIEIVRKIF